MSKFEAKIVTALVDRRLAIGLNVNFEDALRAVADERGHSRDDVSKMYDEEMKRRHPVTSRH